MDLLGLLDLLNNGNSSELLDLIMYLGPDTNLQDMLYNYAHRIASYIAAIVFIFAALQCFFGYKIFRFWVAVHGFFVFGVLGSVLAEHYVNDYGVAVYVGIFCAIIGAIIAYKLYQVGVFIRCGMLGFILGYLLTREISLGVIMATVIGTLAVIFVKPVIILTTSIPNGLLAGSCLAIIFKMDTPVGIILGAVLACLGIFVQFMTNMKSDRNHDRAMEQSVAPVTTESSRAVHRISSASEAPNLEDSGTPTEYPG